MGLGLGGVWLYHVYSYPYNKPWTFYNVTTDSNQTKPVNCLCQEYSECGCDENDNAQFQADILGNGSYAGLNKSVVSVADVDGKSTIILNGTLPNGTTDGESSENSDGFSISHSLMQGGGYWALAAFVSTAVFMI